jgi:hypothetical protein
VSGPIEDRLDVGTALDLIGRKAAGKPAPMACCPRDGEPLIGTFERAGAEFLCMVCGGWFGFPSPEPGDAEKLQARYDELKARFDA